MGQRMMKQWRKGIKIKLKNPVCRRHSKSSEKTKAPSLGHATPKLSPPPHPTAAAQANPGREEGTGSVCGWGDEGLLGVVQSEVQPGEHLYILSHHAC